MRFINVKGTKFRKKGNNWYAILSNGDGYMLPNGNSRCEIPVAEILLFLMEEYEFTIETAHFVLEEIGYRSFELFDYPLCWSLNFKTLVTLETLKKLVYILKFSSYNGLNGEIEHDKKFWDKYEKVVELESTLSKKELHILKSCKTIQDLRQKIKVKDEQC